MGKTIRREQFQTSPGDEKEQGSFGEMQVFTDTANDRCIGNLYQVLGQYSSDQDRQLFGQAAVHGGTWWWW